MTRLLKAHEQPVQQQQLPAAAQQALQPLLARSARLRVVRRPREVGVIAALLQLHHQVDKADGGGLVALGEGGVVLGEDVLVVLLLLPRHVHA